MTNRNKRRAVAMEVRNIKKGPDQVLKFTLQDILPQKIGLPQTKLFRTTFPVTDTPISDADTHTVPVHRLAVYSTP